MELLIIDRSNTKRLLQESVLAVGVFAIVAALGLVELAVGKETAGNSTGTPALAVGPAAHTRLTLVKAVDRARSDGLTLNVREAAVNSSSKTLAAGCIEVQNTRKRTTLNKEKTG